MKKYLTPGVVAGVFSMAGVASVAFGKPALGAFLSDPNTALNATAAIGAVGALVAGFLDGVKKPVA